MQLKTKKYNILPWLIWGVGATFYFSQYMARVVPSVITQQLAHTFSANAFTLGTLSACFYYAYAPMQIPAGLLIDRFGSGKLLAIATFTTAIGCFIFAYTNNIYIADLSRFLLGLGSAFSFVCTLKLIAQWFPAKNFGLLTSITQGLGMFGAIFGVGIISYTVEKIHWRFCIILIGVIFTILTIMTILVMLKSKRALKKQTKQLHNYTTTEPKTTILECLKTVAKNPQSWINVIFIAALYAPITAFCEFWGTSYLRTVYSISVKHAASGISFIFLGWIIGSPIMGYISDTIGKRRPLMIASAFAGLIFLSAILYLPKLNLIYVFTLLFLFGLTNPGVSISYSLSGEINPSFAAGTSIALANMASVTFGLLGQPLIGWLLDLNWKGAMLNGVRHYSAANYRATMSVLVICMLVACISSFFIKETHCRNVSFIENKQNTID
ncbi:MAG: MFS transporter [Gammaproteobacteria bacterium]|jgi:MFS family permease